MSVVSGYALIEQKPAEEGDKDNEEYDIFFDKISHTIEKH